MPVEELRIATNAVAELRNQARQRRQRFLEGDLGQLEEYERIARSILDAALDRIADDRAKRGLDFALLIELARFSTVRGGASWDEAGHPPIDLSARIRKCLLGERGKWLVKADLAIVAEIAGVHFNRKSKVEEIVADIEGAVKSRMIDGLKESLGSRSAGGALAVRESERGR